MFVRQSFSLHRSPPSPSRTHCRSPTMPDTSAPSPPRSVGYLSNTCRPCFFLSPIISISALLLAFAAFAHGPFQPQRRGGIPQEAATENKLFNTPPVRLSALVNLHTQPLNRIFSPGLQSSSKYPAPIDLYISNSIPTTLYFIPLFQLPSPPSPHFSFSCGGQRRRSSGGAGLLGARRPADPLGARR
jgi:hypothetical protein